jgi:hypothetical protein
MRAWIWLLIVAGMAAWLAGPSLAPHSPDPRLWTYQRYEQDQQSFEIARAQGQLHEDPERRKLREAVLTAAARLEYSPCDKQLIPPLRVAIGKHLLEMRNTVQQRLETASIAGQEVDATDFLNTETSQVIREAVNAGLVYREDLPAEVGILFPPRPPRPDHSWYAGRFACKIGDRD